MGLPTPGTNQLQVLRAVEYGWEKRRGCRSRQSPPTEAVIVMHPSGMEWGCCELIRTG
jgi:hypothetical protein